MDRKLTEFIALLRRNGLRVSPPEVADAAAAIGMLGYDDRRRFHEALSCTLAKSRADAVVFEHCFENFFQVADAIDDVGPAASAAAESAGMPPAEPPPGGGQGAGSGGGEGSGVSGAGVPSSPLAGMLLDPTSGQLQLEMARAIARANLAGIRVITQKGLYGRRILMAMGLEDLERELEALDRSPAAGDVLRASLLRSGLASLRLRVRAAVERYLTLVRNPDRDAIVRETDIALLRESADTRAVIRRMARKLITQHRRREKQAARGLLDVRATLRRNLAHDGVLMEPRWRRIRKDRPRVMAVCDVSRSVSRHARFLLLFLYSLQEVIPQLRTFVFSSTLHEVTPLFDDAPVEAALDLVLERHGFGSTDYGRAFADLDELAGAGIDRRTTLIILGDARNNNGEARLDLLHKYHARARQVIWLNPEERLRWGSGDSEMLRYATRCTHAHSCHTLGELERIVDRLLKAS
jgi:uncharacterized protein with von Willebrand factor type A (vWA) domain